MRLTHLRLKGITCFEDEVSLDLDALGPGLIAVVGRNGSGKSSLLESVAASLYLDLPSRPGALYDHARGKDSFVEARFEPEVVTRVLINSEQRKTEAYFNAQGSAITSGRVRDFQEAVAKRFGSREAFLASVFSAQNRAGSFLDASKSERKALFVELLGLGRLQELSEAARERQRALHDSLISARTEDLVVIGKAEKVPRLKASKAEVCGLIGLLGSDLATARETEQNLREEAAKLESDQARLRSLEQQCSAANRAGTSAQIALSSAEKGPEIAQERAYRELDRLDESLPQRMRDRAQERHLAAYEAAARRAQEKLASAKEGFELQKEELRERTALIDDVPCTNWNLPGLVLDEEGAAALSGTCPLLVEANEAKAELETLKFRPPDVKGWKAKQLVEANGALEKDLVDAQTQENSLAVRRGQVEDQLKRDLLGAAALLREAARARDEASVEKARLEQEVVLLAGCMGPSREKGTRGFVEVQQQIARFEQELGDAKQSLGGIEATLRDALEAEGRAVILDGKIQALETDLSEWGILEKALGRDGIQALEIDAAGPAVAGLANELLESCYGPRFSLGFETLREKKSKPGEYTEAFDVQVYDEGTARPVEALSGGERVIVGEALGLALALFNSKRSGIHWETLWRDETAGALDPANAARYVDMLRRARELGGFHQVIFVSHQEQVWERADVRVTVQGGTVAVSA